MCYYEGWAYMFQSRVARWKIVFFHNSELNRLNFSIFKCPKTQNKGIMALHFPTSSQHFFVYFSLFIDRDFT